MKFYRSFFLGGEEAFCSVVGLCVTGEVERTDELVALRMSELPSPVGCPDDASPIPRLLRRPESRPISSLLNRSSRRVETLPVRLALCAVSALWSFGLSARGVAAPPSPSPLGGTADSVGWTCTVDKLYDVLGEVPIAYSLCALASTV